SHRIGRAGQYRVVPLGFDLDRVAAIDEQARARARIVLQIPAGVPVVTTIVRLTAIKNHSLFLDAAEAIARQHPETIFLIAGADGRRPSRARGPRAGAAQRSSAATRDGRSRPPARARALRNGSSGRRR